MVKRKVNRDGYSLVELLIATAMSAIVLGGLITLLAFGTLNMNRTQTRVALQNQAKDAMRHMSAYVMEAKDAIWNDEKRILTVVNENVAEDGTIRKTEKCYYWYIGDKVYFGKSSDGVKPEEALPTDKKHLLVSDIVDFQTKIQKNEESGNKLVHLSLSLKKEKIEFECDEEVYMRNQ